MKLLLLPCLAAVLAAGCQPQLEAAPEVALQWSVAPDPPAVGPAELTVSLADERTGQPIAGADLKIEGLMSHPGMKPAFATARETSPGRYEARLDLTMAGDWILLIEAALPDGRTLRRQVPLPGVRAQP